MKIHILYDFTEDAYGGGNQFLKSLRDELNRRQSYEADWEKADGVLINSYHRLAEALRIGLRRPETAFIHRLGPIFHLHRPQVWKNIDRNVIRIANRVARSVVFQSEWSYRQALELGLLPGKSHFIIHNAPDLTVFFRKPETKIAPDRKIRLIADSWSDNPNKGLAYYRYLDAQLDFTKYEMTFIGRSSVRFNHIRQIPPLNSRELADQLRQHDIFISGAKDDACSNSILEALACGLPVVALNSGGNAEIVKRGGALFTGEGDIIVSIEKVQKEFLSYQHAIRVPTITSVADSYLKCATEALHQPARLSRRILLLLLTRLRLSKLRINLYNRTRKN